MVQLISVLFPIFKPLRRKQGPPKSSTPCQYIHTYINILCICIYAYISIYIYTHPNLLTAGRGAQGLLPCACHDSPEMHDHPERICGVQGIRLGSCKDHMLSTPESL